MQTRKSLPELEAELYAARMLLLNTYPSEVCSQLMEMYSKLVMHTTKSVDAQPAAPPPQTPTPALADATTITDHADAPTTSHHAEAPNVPVSSWRLCFGTATAEARFARWLTMHSVAGDIDGLRNTLLFSTVLLLLLCATTAADATILTSYWPCIAWLVPSTLLSTAAYTTITRCSVWYPIHREGTCATLRILLLLGGLAHTLCCWEPATRTAQAPLMACFLACIVAYPSVQFAVRWQTHVVLQLVQLLLLLVATPFLFHWSGDNGELVVVLLVFACFGFFLPCVLLHSAERRLRFLFAEASQRSA